MSKDKIEVGGFVVVGMHRIEGINSPTTETAKFDMLSTSVCRWVRREFNLLTASLYIQCRDEQFKRRIQALLIDAEEEAEVLTSMVLRYEMPAPTPVLSLQMRLVSEEAQQLFEILQIADRAIFKLMHSDLNELVEENSAPFFRAIGRIKQSSLEQSLKFKRQIGAVGFGTCHSQAA